MWSSTNKQKKKGLIQIHSCRSTIFLPTMLCSYVDMIVPMQAILGGRDRVAYKRICHVHTCNTRGIHIDNFSFFSLCESHSSSIIRVYKLCMWTVFVLRFEFLNVEV